VGLWGDPICFSARVLPSPLAGGRVTFCDLINSKWAFRCSVWLLRVISIYTEGFQALVYLINIRWLQSRRIGDSIPKPMVLNWLGPRIPGLKLEVHSGVIGGPSATPRVGLRVRLAEEAMLRVRVPVPHLIAVPNQWTFADCPA